MKGRQLAVLYLVFSCLTAGAVWAQSGGIEGRVARSDGAGLGGVAVIIDQLGEAGLTDNSGSYAFRGVPAGTYDLSFTLGDNVETKSGVEVTGGEIARLDVEVDWDIAFAETITVMSASRRAERIVEAPAAVTLVTPAEIQRQASHGQLPKLLEFTPGAEVTQSGLYDYNFNTRGFNSSLNRRVATVIDGRNPSVPFLGAQEWVATSFPMDDIQSLEFVRGPSAALYGANASSGVVNLVTKAPRTSQGGLLRLTAGEVSTTNVDLRWATEMGGGWYFKLLGGLRNTGDFSVSRTLDRGVEYTVPCETTGRTSECLPLERVPLDPEDDNEVSFYTLRFDKHFKNGHVLTAEGSQASVEGPTLQTGIGRVQLKELDKPYYRVNYNAPRWNLSFSETRRDAPRQTSLSSGGNLVLDTSRQSVELQTNWDLGDKARIVGGLSFSEEDIDTLDPATGRQSLVFQPIANEMSAIFAQLDWDLSDNVKLVLAGRSDENDLHDTQFSPKAALVWQVDSNNSLRLTYNEAFQVANYSEFFLQADVALPITALAPLEQLFCAPFGVQCGLGLVRVLALGNVSLDLEEVETIELGYSGILGNKAYLTIDYYQGENTNFITDLIPNVGTTLGRTNPNFGAYQPPAGLPGPVADQLQLTLLSLLGPTFFAMSNNVDGSPIVAAVSYANFGDVDTEGLDLGLNYYVDDNWTINFSYSWFDFDIQEDLPGFANLLVPNTPETKMVFGFSYVADRWDFNLSSRTVDDFAWAVGPFVGTVESYTTVDLGFNFEINDNWKFGVNVANAFDDIHYESFGGDLLERRALGNITFSW